MFQYLTHRNKSENNKKELRGPDISLNTQKNSWKMKQWNNSPGKQSPITFQI